MQTILGANGQIGRELARILKSEYTDDIRLVSRRPTKVSESDQLFSADLLNPDQTSQAVAGSEIVYLTAGLPMNTGMWVEQWPVIMANVIDACVEHGAKLVYFDNTYMYPQTEQPQTEETRFQPNGDKGKVRGKITQMLLDVMAQGKVEAIICRAPEFYGPGKTQSMTNTAVINNLKQNKKARVFLRDDTLRSLIYTPDASRAMALLGNTEDAYGQTWHLPCDDNRLTYRAFVELAAEVFEVDSRYSVVKSWQMKIAGLVSEQVRDAAELLPRYGVDNIFISDKFKKRFPKFKVTTLREGLEAIRDEE